MVRPPPSSPLFPYTTLFRSHGRTRRAEQRPDDQCTVNAAVGALERRGAGEGQRFATIKRRAKTDFERSEEHTSELQSHVNLVCRLLLEKKNNINKINCDSEH